MGLQPFAIIQDLGYIDETLQEIHAEIKQFIGRFGKISEIINHAKAEFGGAVHAHLLNPVINTLGEEGRRYHPQTGDLLLYTKDNKINRS
ncbi:hypothetical protein ACFFIX_16925 [Metabacillus herbersteinensis]|uniref:LXG domain-containing protein n=1 Tax=Metabacillus herbersteinensis TaxID=283816 RepID=A0ABV6GJM5_9BACI